MKLHQPFIITSRLMPGLRLGAGTLSLERLSYDPAEGRQVAHMIIDLPGVNTYFDATLKSGVGGFDSYVEAFESYLGFLGAALESYRNGGDPNDPDSNVSLFPDWLMDELNVNDVDCLRYDLYADTETGRINHELIEEAA